VAVYKNRDSAAALKRGSYPSIIEFQRFLNDGGVQNPVAIGNFELGRGGLFCDVSPFVHGYQKETGFDLEPEERKSMAETLANMHLLSEKFKPTSGETYKSGGLPGGYIHADYKANNLIFDPNTHKVKAVLDFEMAQPNSFAFELGRTLRKLATRFNLQKEGLSVRADPERAYAFLDDYMKVRPIGAEEAAVITSNFRQGLCEKIRRENEKRHVLSEDELEYQIRNIITPAIAEFDMSSRLPQKPKKIDGPD
jgi:hypothetical protein